MNPEIEKYRLDIAIVRETASRIIDDFEMFGIAIIFSGSEKTAYNELMQQLVPAIENLLQKDRSKLLRVLRTIDISEEKLSGEITSMPAVPLSEIISSLIIEREMQKVVTRKFFRK